jgi:hypothetical protein
MQKRFGNLDCYEPVKFVRDFTKNGSAGIHSANVIAPFLRDYWSVEGYQRGGSRNVVGYERTQSRTADTFWQKT